MILRYIFSVMCRVSFDTPDFFCDSLFVIAHKVVNIKNLYLCDCWIVEFCCYVSAFFSAFVYLNFCSCSHEVLFVPLFVVLAGCSRFQGSFVIAGG